MFIELIWLQSTPLRFHWIYWGSEFCGHILNVLMLLPETFVVIVDQPGLFEVLRDKVGFWLSDAEALTVIVFVLVGLLGVETVNVTLYCPVGNRIGKGVFKFDEVTLAVFEPDVVVIDHWTTVFWLFPKLVVFKVKRTDEEPQIFKVLLKCCGLVVKSANCPQAGLRLKKKRRNKPSSFFIIKQSSWTNHFK